MSFNDWAKKWSKIKGEQLINKNMILIMYWSLCLTLCWLCTDQPSSGEFKNKQMSQPVYFFW